MPIQVSAQGFELTEGLKQSCVAETEDKLQNLAVSNFTVKWMLRLEREEKIAHLNWNDGGFHGDVTVGTDDMYTSIHSCVKKAAEQIKKAHQKSYDHHK